MKIKCAAMVWRGRVHEGPHHGAVIHRLAATIPRSQWPVVGHQGFVTECGVYMDREDALSIALVANQIVKKHGNPRLLFSEDFVTGYVEPPLRRPMLDVALALLNEMCSCPLGQRFKRGRKAIALLHELATIQGQPIRDHLYYQFPATKSYIPLANLLTKIEMFNSK